MTLLISCSKATIVHGERLTSDSRRQTSSSAVAGGRGGVGARSTRPSGWRGAVRRRLPGRVLHGRLQLPAGSPGGCRPSYRRRGGRGGGGVSRARGPPPPAGGGGP